MNNDINVMLGIMWILMALSGIAAYRSFIVVKAYIGMMRRRQKYPSVAKANPLTLCSGGHKWDSVKLVLANLPVDTYKVCTDCGFVSGVENYQLNGPGLEVYKNTVKLRNERKAKWDATVLKKQRETQDIMNKLIRAHVADLTNDLHKNIEVLQQFFRKSNLEMESLYEKLNHDLDEDGHGPR
jgi:hypothetical protein